MLDEASKCVRALDCIVPKIFGAGMNRKKAEQQSTSTLDCRIGIPPPKAKDLIVLTNLEA